MTDLDQVVQPYNYLFLLTCSYNVSFDISSDRYINKGDGGFFDDGGHVVVLVHGKAATEEAGAYYQIIVFFIHLAHTETYLYLTQKARKTQKLLIRTQISQISQIY